MSECRLTEIGAIIEKLTTLKELLLSNNSIKTIHSNIGRLHCLKRLILHHNSITSVPEEIGALCQLEELHLSFNSLNDRIPAKIGDCLSLRVLRLQSCRIPHLPEEITHLVQLTELDVSSNELNFLPQEIGKLINLNILEVQNNRLTDIPISIGRCKKLSRQDGLNISRNPIADVEMLRQHQFGTEALLTYLQTRLDNAMVIDAQSSPKDEVLKAKVEQIIRWTQNSINTLKEQLNVMKKNLARQGDQREVHRTIAVTNSMMQILEERRSILPQVRPMTTAIGDERKKAESHVQELNLNLSSVSKALAQKDPSGATTEIFPLIKFIRALQEEMDREKTENNTPPPSRVNSVSMAPTPDFRPKADSPKIVMRSTSDSVSNLFSNRSATTPAPGSSTIYRPPARSNSPSKRQTVSTQPIVVPQSPLTQIKKTISTDAIDKSELNARMKQNPQITVDQGGPPRIVQTTTATKDGEFGLSPHTQNDVARVKWRSSGSSRAPSVSIAPRPLVGNRGSVALTETPTTTNVMTMRGTIPIPTALFFMPLPPTRTNPKESKVRCPQPARPIPKSTAKVRR